MVSSKQGEANLDKDQFLLLCRQANAGDQGSLAKLRHVLAATPSISESMGNLAAMTQHALCNSIIPGDVAMGEIVRQKASQMREELEAGASCPIVRLAVDRAVLTWLAVHQLELRYTDVTRMPTPEANLVLKQKIAAERRHQAALRTLATIRQLQESDRTDRCRKSKSAGKSKPELNVIREV